jgi:hypothetical protein
MLAISPKVGEFLLKATKARDIDDAFRRVLSEYLSMKAAHFANISEALAQKWGMDFPEFKRRLEKGKLGNNSYSYDTEQDFWEWEEAETLKRHYESLSEQWT